MRKFSIYMPEQVHAMLKSGAAMHQVRIGQLINALVLLHANEIMVPGNEAMDKTLEMILAGERGQNPTGFATMVRRFRNVTVDGIEVKADE
jgi:hypothetical protein